MPCLIKPITKTISSSLGFIANKSKRILTPAYATEIAQHFQAGQYILGSVVKLGRQIQLNASLYATDGTAELKAQAIAEDESHLLTSIDALAQRLIAGRLSSAKKQLAGLAVLSTTSLPAMKAYLEGEKQLRAGEFDHAVEAYQAALTEDSTFALAWYRLSRAAGWAFRRDVEHIASERAFELSYKLPEQTRRLLLANQAFTAGRPAEAEKLYRAILVNRPDNLHALQDLGDLLYHYNRFFGRPVSESRPYFERALLYDINNIEAVYHLIEMAGQENRFDEMDSLITRYRHLETAKTRLEWKTVRTLHNGSEQERESLFTELTKAEAIRKVEACIKALRVNRDIPAAQRIARMLSEPSVPENLRVLGQRVVALLEAAMGRIDTASDELNAVPPDFTGHTLLYQVWFGTLPFYPVSDARLEQFKARIASWDTLTAPLLTRDKEPIHQGELFDVKLYMTGLIDDRLNDSAGLQRNIEALERRAVTRGQTSLAYALASTLKAQQMWRDGDSKGALALLDTVPFQMNWFSAGDSFLYSQIRIIYLRAQLHRSLGQYEDAVRWYHALQDGDFGMGMPYLGVSYLGEAECYAKLGDLTKAIYYYNRFIELWQDCDTVLRPMLREAEQKRERLLQEMTKEPLEKQNPALK